MGDLAKFILAEAKISAR